METTYEIGQKVTYRWRGEVCTGVIHGLTYPQDRGGAKKITYLLPESYVDHDPEVPEDVFYKPAKVKAAKAAKKKFAEMPAISNDDGTIKPEAKALLDELEQYGETDNKVVQARIDKIKAEHTHNELCPIVPRQVRPADIIGLAK